jgi:hypothetical protein
MLIFSGLYVRQDVESEVHKAVGQFMMFVFNNILNEHVQDLSEFLVDIILLPFLASVIMPIYRGKCQPHLLIADKAPIFYDCRYY